MILVVGVFAAIMFLVNQLNVYQNQRIIQTMTMEYSIISMSDNLIKTYNNAGKNSGNMQFFSEYRTIKENLLNVIILLKTRIVSEESRMLLLGVEHTANMVISECDAGLKEIKAGELQNFSEHFAQAHKENEFVQSNTATLLQKELEYLSSTQEKSQQLYFITLITSSIIFLFVIFVMIIYASNFSKQLINPIENLTKSVEQVAAGKMDVLINQELINQKDEVGILSRSFEMMVINIKDMITKLNYSNIQITNSKDALEKGNTELKKLNQFMVDREIKMIELKKRISELEKSSMQQGKI
ncbi:MAG: HAMP domain-containing protein [Candidatus Roizmanbacteria bacterium]|nr:HAMP domain-containing protein [Candidatus Roizmanbacteria bacterium]